MVEIAWKSYQMGLQDAVFYNSVVIKAERAPSEKFLGQTARKKAFLLYKCEL